MKSARPALRRAVGMRLTEAFGGDLSWTVNPSPGRAMPYGVLSDITETGAASTKLTDGSVMTQTLRIYSTSEAEAARLGARAVQALTRRNDPLDLGETFYEIGRPILEMFDVIGDRTETGDVFGAAIRVRYTIGHTESPEMAEG